MSLQEIAEREREAFEAHVKRQEEAMEGGKYRESGGPVLGLPLPDTRPPVREGAVLATMFNELGTVFRRIQMADAFEKKVTEAAKSPAAWLLLREELNGAKEPTP